MPLFTRQLVRPRLLCRLVVPVALLVLGPLTAVSVVWSALTSSPAAASDGQTTTTTSPDSTTTTAPLGTTNGGTLTPTNGGAGTASNGGSGSTTTTTAPAGTTNGGATNPGSTTTTPSSSGGATTTTAPPSSAGGATTTTAPPATRPASTAPTMVPTVAPRSSPPTTVPRPYAAPAAAGHAGAVAQTPAPAASSRGQVALAAPPPPVVLRLLGSPFSGHVRLTSLDLVLLALFVLMIVVLTVVSGTTLWWMLHAWRTPDTLAGTGFGARAPGVGPGAMRIGRSRSYSLIVPARHEEGVLGDTLRLLADVDHPDVEVLAVVGHDDPGTYAVAEAVAHERPDRVRVLVDRSWPKNKPKALNTALGECRNEITGVFDAEDEVHPALLREVDRCFDDTGADVVQGGVQLMNYRSSWWALHNVLEYYFWFRSRLHFHAGRRFIPLGGNTVFIRTDLLRSAGGWDDNCLAEDCELGVRLSTAGATVAVAYEPGLVTREETPPTVPSLVRQRTRWNQGFLQVLRKGVWRALPTLRQRLLARYTLSMPFLQAFSALIVPISVLSIVMLRLPVAIALLSFLPLVPTILTVAVQAAGLREFCKNYGTRARLRDYVRLVVGTLPYQVLLGYAATRAVAREARGARSWEKTAHLGAHRQTEVSTAGGLA